MQKFYLTEWLWGSKGRLGFLLTAAFILLISMLGVKEIWTQEHRWVNIASNMLYYKNYFHPILDGKEYYDKPLLSYWLIVGFSYFAGKLNLWVLRLPSAIAGIMAIWAIYQLGTFLRDKSLGLLAGWMLLTTYYFVFWARVSSADMLNLAGSLLAVTWYFYHRNSTRFSVYAVFFLILALTALCKGLVAVAVALIAIFPDLVLQKSVKKHLNFQLVLGFIPALIIYLLPFCISSYLSNDQFTHSGLYEVFKENITRYFKPFDHKAPFFAYLYYFPLYLCPWIVFFIPAAWSLKNRWMTLSLHSQWMVWATFLLFIFFTLSGSRRSYYILPVLPFAILMIADWIIEGREQLQKRYFWAGKLVVVSLLLFTLIFIVVQPLFYTRGGVPNFNKVLKKESAKIMPWSHWDLSLLDAESKLYYYLELSPDIKNLDTHAKRENQTIETLLRDFPILQTQPSNTIIISRRLHVPLLNQILKNYKLVESEPTYLELFFKNPDNNLPVAFIPMRKIL